MKNVFALVALASISACSDYGTRNSSTTESVENANSGIVSCSKSNSGTDKYRLEMVAAGDSLSIRQSSTTGRFAPLEYKISLVSLLTAPVDKPIFSCEKNNNLIVVWEKFARINSRYYILESISTNQGNTSAQNISCTKALNGSDKYTMTITVTDKTLSIRQSSTTGRFEPLKYFISRISLLTAPVEAPQFSCEEGQTLIMVWDSVARVNSGYYRLTK